jgi:AcrR family transcriptional regulator
MATKNKTVKARAAQTRAERPSLRERQREMTREALLQGAAEAFAEHGYNDVTIDDIASRAGTSRGTFYLHFSKGEILAELIQRAFFASIGSSSESGLFADLHAARPYTVESVSAWLEGYIAVWQRNKLLVRAWMEGDATDPEVEKMTRWRVERAVSVLSTVLTEQRADDAEPADEELLRARATLMDLLLQSFCFNVVVRGLRVDYELGLRALAEQWVDAIHRPT